MQIKFREQFEKDIDTITQVHIIKAIATVIQQVKQATKHSTSQKNERIMMKKKFGITITQFGINHFILL